MLNHAMQKTWKDMEGIWVSSGSESDGEGQQGAKRQRFMGTDDFVPFMGAANMTPGRIQAVMSLDRWVSADAIAIYVEALRKDWKVRNRAHAHPMHACPSMPTACHSHHSHSACSMSLPTCAQPDGS